MSISIMTYAWRVPCDTSSSKLVLMKLADHASDDGVCWPSWGHLIKHTGLSRATIARSLAELEKVNYISRQSRSGTSTMYTINVDAIKNATPYELRKHNGKGYQNETTIDPSQDETTPSQPETPTRLTVTPPPSHGETLTISKPPDKSSKEPSKSDRLRVVYFAWCSSSGGESDKVQFSKSISPLLEKYSDAVIISAVQEYFRLLDNKKFMSVRRFAETIQAYISSSAAKSRGIDPNSDMPASEQIRHIR